MTQSRKYAVTGNIGSGKSTVLEILKDLGYPVFSCDEISRGLWQQAEYTEGLARLFPSAVRGGKIGKAPLAALVFSDPSALRTLNAYSHPRIMEELFRRMREYPLSFAEVPLLFEEGLEGGFDGVIAVRRERNARLCAAAERDGSDPSEIERRAANQLDPALLEERDCVIVENDCPKDGLKEKVCAALAALGIP